LYCLLLRANTRHITPRAPRSRCLGSADKKRPLGSHPQRSGVLFPVTSSECSRRSALRSGRTVRGGSDDRSWFGRPQAIRKGGRECRQQQGDERVENTGVTSGTTLLRQSVVPWVPFTNCQKKRGPTPSEFDALPLHRRSNRRITRGSPTGRRGYDQTTTEVSKPRKSRGPTLCSVRRIHLLRMMLFYVCSATNPSAISRTAH
jgi:hypothetical protein